MPLRTWSPRLFAYARISVLAFVFLTFGSMTLYPGGTYVNRQSRGYDFLRNFLSDLGMPLSWGDQANPVGAFLFVSGEVCLATGLLAFFVAFSLSRRLLLVQGTGGGLRPSSGSL